ncbi:MAG: hypothetical protein C4297_03025 [Gemmataceae bacterium]|mgnify:CR=1 FL=1
MDLLTLFLTGCLQATPGANLPEPYFTNQKSFQIPIELKLDPAQQKQIEQLLLYVSTDKGKTWLEAAVASVQQQAFPFFAPHDGEYWFSLVMVDRNRRREPADVAAAPPELIVVVDTKKPVVRILRLEHERQGVLVEWEVSDEYPDLNTLKIEKKQGDNAAWEPVSSVTPSLRGRTLVAADVRQPLALRIQVQDLAGNVGVVTRELAPSSVLTPAPNSESESLRPIMPTSNKSGAPSTAAYEPPPFPAAVSSESGTVARPGDVVPGVIASSDAPARPRSTAAPLEQVASPPSAPQPAGPVMPAVQYVNSLRFDLDYEIARVGPSGVGTVELWVTRDDGRTWQRLGEDPDRRPPFPVELQEEGVYGFKLIVRNKAGLGRGIPQPGESPDVRVEVDVTPPQAKLYAPEADPRKKDTLTLVWEVIDRNLATRPIAIKWAERPEGPWQVIASDLPNTGRYLWKLPQEIPYRVYLRLEAQDQAGNISVAETPQPVLVDLQEPDARILGVVVPARRP